MRPRRDARVGGSGQAARESGHRELPDRAPAPGGNAMKFAVVVFPGSNCDHDAYHAAKHVLGQHDRVRLAQGHVAARRRRRHPARRVLVRRLPAHRRHRALLAGDGGRAALRAEGGPVLGICNGFQILLEAGLLPGALLRNAGQVPLRARRPARRADRHAVHRGLHAGTGAAHADRARRGQLLRRRRTCSTARGEPPGRLPLRHAAGEVTAEANPNGSLNNIAGICNAGRNVVGLMPHPERACEQLLGSEDGRCSSRCSRSCRTVRRCARDGWRRHRRALPRAMSAWRIAHARA